MELSKKENYNFEDLKEIMRILRSENGCPWDKEQTHKSIRNNFIEEVYEAIEAIDDEDPGLLKEELGDVLLQIVFQAQIGSESGEFDIDGVCDGICKKLIIRHPHIFADTVADDSAQVLSNWENIKIKEKGYAGDREYIESAAKSLPALMRAEKIQKRIIKRKIAEQPSTGEIIKKLKEIMEIWEKSEQHNIDSETIGGILYDVVTLANTCDINSEQALYDFNKKVIESVKIK